MPVTLPPRLAALQSQTGKHRAGRKILIFGDSKTGKSFFAASAPHPIAALACVEPGIVPYLSKEKGDLPLEIYTRDDYYAAMDFILAKQDDFASIVVDNGDLLFAQIMAEAEDELGRDLKAQDWRGIKGVWNSTLFAVGRSKQNFVMTVGRKDIAFAKEESGIQGVEGRMTVLPQDVPHAEKNVPRFVDMILKTDVQRDKMNRPTPIHTVTFVGGRRPPSIPPETLHTGKVWKFDSRKQCDVWGEVIAPLDAAWSDGAVEHLGIDPREVAVSNDEMRNAYMDQEVGRLISLIEGPHASLAAFGETFAKEIQVPLNELDAERKAFVIATKERRKKELK